MDFQASEKRFFACYSVLHALDTIGVLMNYGAGVPPDGRQDFYDGG